MRKSFGLPYQGSKNQIVENINTSAPIEYSNISYENYKFINEDIVYCDSPYENTLYGGYKGINSDKFYD